MQGMRCKRQQLSHRKHLDDHFTVGDSALWKDFPWTPAVHSQTMWTAKIGSKLIEYIAKTWITACARTPVRLSYFSIFKPW
jgi:hypothetical protein